jgi:hypothetical protein
MDRLRIEERPHRFTAADGYPAGDAADALQSDLVEAFKPLVRRTHIS